MMIEIEDAELIRDREYRTAAHPRTDALVESVLPPTVALGGGR